MDYCRVIYVRDESPADGGGSGAPARKKVDTFTFTFSKGGSRFSVSASAIPERLAWCLTMNLPGLTLMRGVTYGYILRGSRRVRILLIKCVGSFKIETLPRGTEDEERARTNLLLPKSSSVIRDTNIFQPLIHKNKPIESRSFWFGTDLQGAGRS